MGRKFRYTDKEVKEAILRAFTQQKTNKLGFRALYRELQKDPNVKIGGFTTLQRCLKRYVDDGFLKRDEKGGYELTEIGFLDYGKIVDRHVIDKTKRIWQDEIVPDPYNEKLDQMHLVSGILPFNVSIQLNPKITPLSKRLDKELQKEFGIKIGKKERLDGITRSITAFYETWFEAIPDWIDQYWTAHKVQNLSTKKRLAFLESIHPRSSAETVKEHIESLKERLEDDLNETFEGEESLPRTLEELLDFEGLCIVRVSVDTMKKESEYFRIELLIMFLENPWQPRAACVDKHPIMRIVLNPEEYSEYSKTKTVKQREKFIQKLRKKYAKPISQREKFLQKYEEIQRAR